MPYGCHSGSAKAKNKRCMLSATKQARGIKPATKVGRFLRDLDFAKFIWLDQLVSSSFFARKTNKQPQPSNRNYYVQNKWTKVTACVERKRVRIPTLFVQTRQNNVHIFGTIAFDEQLTDRQTVILHTNDDKCEPTYLWALFEYRRDSVFYHVYTCDCLWATDLVCKLSYTHKVCCFLRERNISEWFNNLGSLWGGKAHSLPLSVPLLFSLPERKWKSTGYMKVRRKERIQGKEESIKEKRKEERKTRKDERASLNESVYGVVFVHLIMSASELTPDFISHWNEQSFIH